MRAAGAAATAGLWIADRLPFESLQILAARVVRKLYKAGGAAAEPGITGFRAGA
jgi:hypothetical protein